nr:MAG: capsid protein [Cressdnaviricota sp.]
MSASSRGTVKGVASVINQQNTRASMKRSGKLLAVKGTKHVKVSSSLRKKIKEVIKEDEIRGTYTKIGWVPIGLLCDNSAVGTSSIVTSTQFNGSSQDACNWVHKGSNGFQGSWQCASAFSNSSTGLLEFTTGADWNFFTAAKYLDAASVLFNRKLPNLDYQLTTGNMLLKTNGGGSQISTNGPVGLKLDVIDSFVTWEYRNTCQRGMFVETFVCTPKTKFQSTNPLTDLRTAAETETGSVGAPYVGNWSQNPTYQTWLGGDLAKTIGVDPNAFAGFAAKWSYEKTVMFIKAGETCIHKIQGPKNFTVDYNNLTGPGGSALTYVTKFSKCVMIRVYPEAVMSNQLLSAGSNAMAAPGYWYEAPVTVLQFNDAMACKMTETFKISCPEPAGFIFGASTTAGLSQTLDLRKPTKALFTYPTLEATDMGLGAYNTYDEENPGAVIASGIQN